MIWKVEKMNFCFCRFDRRTKYPNEAVSLTFKYDESLTKVYITIIITVFIENFFLLHLINVCVCVFLFLVRNEKVWQLKQHLATLLFQ